MTQRLCYILRTEKPVESAKKLREMGICAKVFPDPKAPSKLIVAIETINDQVQKTFGEFKALGGNIVDEYYSDRLRQE
ncbi:MAG: hypothetical protein ACP5KD_07380 [Fervidobacterium sp.]|jgi:hypothetical protein